MDIASKTLFVSVVLYLFEMSCALCPRYQVPHVLSGQTVCCQPVFGCQVDHEVVFCTEDGGQDECRRCKAGHVNWYNSSSLDTVRRKCFFLSKEHDNQCPIDTHPTADREYCEHMNCKCQVEICYFGDPCIGCQLRPTQCPQDEEMNNKTGKCEPCKSMMNSPVGCAPCQYNETAWRISQKDKESNDVDTTVTSTKKPGYTILTDKPNNKTDAQKTDEDKTDNIMLPVIIVIVVLVAAGILIACFLYAKRKARNGDESTFPAIMYTKFCSRGQPDTESLATPTTNGGAPPTTIDRAPLTTDGRNMSNYSGEPMVAAVSPMPQGASASDDGTSEAARMDLLKNGTDAECGAEGDTTDVKQRKGEN